jgi:hypothetical protein
MNMIFLMNFFNINLPLKDILQRFEHDLLMEYRNKMIAHRTLEELGFLRENDLVTERYEDGMTKETFLTVVNLHSRQKATTV